MRYACLLTSAQTELGHLRVAAVDAEPTLSRTKSAICLAGSPPPRQVCSFFVATAGSAQGFHRVVLAGVMLPKLSPAFVREHGGRLWVWAAHPRLCCSGSPAWMHAATDPPERLSGFSPDPPSRIGCVSVA